MHTTHGPPVDDIRALAAGQPLHRHISSRHACTYMTCLALRPHRSQGSQAAPHSTWFVCMYYLLAQAGDPLGRRGGHANMQTDLWQRTSQAKRQARAQRTAARPATYKTV
jgi:hypothetical protein